MKGSIIKDRYLVQELLGEGGMGAVYRAVDTTSRDMVALKVLFDKGDDAALLRSLGHEARAVARLHHSNIVRLVDFGRSEHGPCLVMEYAPGHSLKRWIGYLSMRQIAPMFDEILGALAYAHARGVVHRDLKPDNILVVEDARGTLRPMLVDFGLARVAELSGKLAGEFKGKIMGTPSYMAPEQAQAQVRLIGQATDLYAVGTMLYEFTSGQVPFKFDNMMATILAQVREPVPPLRPMPGVTMPPGFAQFVLRMLEKDPAARFFCAADARRALRELDWSQASTVAPGGRVVDMGGFGNDATVDGVSGEVEHTGGGGGPLLKTLFNDGLATIAGTLADPDVAAPLSPGLFGMREVPLVGRVRERGMLWRELETMQAERSVRALVLSGPSGIGKSRLVRWLAERAEEEGLTTTLSAGVGPNAILPMGGLRTLIERLLRAQGLDRDALREVVQSDLVEPGLFQSSEIEPLLDYLRPDVRQGGAFMSDGAIEPVGMVARLLRGATRRRPVLLWLDDVGGADARLITDLIDFLVASRAFSPMPVLVVATIRDALPGQSERSDLEASQTLWNLARDEEAVRWHAVGAMPADEMGKLARAMLPLDDAAVAALVGQANGYPQFATHLIDHWLRHEQLKALPSGQMTVAGSASDEGPRTVARMLTSQLADVLFRAPDAHFARSIVEIAAVCGHQFEHAVMARVLELDDRADQLTELDAVWDLLIENDLWVELDKGTARFASEELLDHVEETMLRPAEAVRLHGLVAQALTEVHAHEIARFHGELALHYNTAGRFDDAATHLVLGAEQARIWGRLHESAQWYEAARDLVEQRTVARRLELMDRIDLGQAVVALQRGAFEAVEPLLTSIQGRTRASARQDVLSKLALLRAELSRARGRLDEAEPQYGKALQILQRHGEALDLAQAYRGLAELYVLKVRYDEAARAAEQAVKSIGRGGDPLLLGRVLLVEGKIAALQHDFGAAGTRYELAREVFAEAGARQGAAEARFAGVHLLIHQGRYDEALTELQSVLEAFIDVGDQASIAQTHRAIGQLARLTGDLERAESSLLTSLDMARRIGDELAVARAHNGLGELARQRGAWPAARSHYLAYIERASGVGDTLSVMIGTANLGLIEMQLGNREAAAEAFERAVALVRRAGNRPFLGAFLGCLAHARAASGDLERANTALREALAIDEDVKIAEKDFLNALEGYAATVGAREVALARRALEVASARWQTRGDDAAVARIEAALAALPA